jgi:Type VIII secretion system (T8SS), CsgF protein
MCDLKRGRTVMGKTGFWVACVVGMIGFVTPAFATEQVYHPISPVLGGNPLNGSFLLSTAQAQGEGVNSGNQGPTINFPNFTPTTPSQTTPAQQQSLGTVANPLSGKSGMP